ncbi:hypothetical protein AKG11_05100 [Shinella sp. SUS2]|nr:hypothetical protein AKG11_05100 [Shinella sp. SUS2]KOC71804.1 hypothetical protein AKG10_30900 [Shinella sp. GWS1]
MALPRLTNDEDAEAGGTPASSLAPASFAAGLGNWMMASLCGGPSGEVDTPASAPVSPPNFEGRFMCNSFGLEQSEDHIEATECTEIILANPERMSPRMK